MLNIEFFDKLIVFWCAQLENLILVSLIEKLSLGVFCQTFFLSAFHFQNQRTSQSLTKFNKEELQTYAFHLQCL